MGTIITSGGSGATTQIVENGILTFTKDITIRGDAAPISGALSLDLTNAILAGREVVRYNDIVTPFPIAGVTLIGDDNFQPSVDLHLLFWHQNGTVYGNYISPKYLATNPIAVNITIDGDFNVNGDVEIFYDYFGGIEGATTFQLYESLTALPGSWTPIAGLNSKINTLLPAQENMYIRAGVTAVSDLPATGEEQFSPAYGPIAAAPFGPDSIPGYLGFLHLHKSETAPAFVDDGGVPPRFVSALDDSPLNTYHFDESGTTAPELIREDPGVTKGELVFVNTEVSRVRVSPLNPLPVLINDPRTEAIRLNVDPSLGSGFMYLEFVDGANYLIIDNTRVGVLNGGVLIQSAPQAALVDGLWHNLIFRSDATDGLSVHLDGVEIINDPSHHFAFPLTSSGYGRVGPANNALRGGLRILDYWDNRISDADNTNLNTWMDQF